MTFNFSKTLMVLFICLAFVGQAMATTVMSYQMISMMGINAQEKSPDMSTMEHCKHNQIRGSSASSEVNSSELSTESCCNQVCNCFTGGCASIAVFVKHAVATHHTIVDLPSKILSYSHFALSQQPTSLYRPPILS